jgi:hypothetical protein
MITPLDKSKSSFHVVLVQKIIIAGVLLKDFTTVHALLKMVRYVFVRPLRPELDGQYSA